MAATVTIATMIPDEVKPPCNTMKTELGLVVQGPTPSIMENWWAWWWYECYVPGARSHSTAVPSLRRTRIGIVATVPLVGVAFTVVYISGGRGF